MPYKATHENGTTSLALLTPKAAKRAASSPINDLKPIKQPKIQVYAEFGDLESLLSSNRCGELLVIKDYMLLEVSFFLQSFREFKYNIARNLAGALIQTEPQIILILKVEIYGRDPADDPHSTSLAKPILDVKEVTTVNHDNVVKLIIGTLQWNALITGSIELTSGTICAGANNFSARRSPQAIIWGRNDWEHNQLSLRQLKSKFHRKETYESCAAIFYPFNNWECTPVKVFSLWSYYSAKSAQTGTKAAAEIFNEISRSRSRSIKKKKLEELLRYEKSSDALKTQEIIGDLLHLIPKDEKKLKLIGNFKASNLLMKLANTLCDTIRSNNLGKVVSNIQDIVEKTLDKKSTIKKEACGAK
ncbi:hypothetical protein BCR41DRAFT_398558 [Lobosporangium transversale]|uniref:Uncharacterized protein n=1 Tax=Lobosporangium transversale TaxID=64571 RepID=A0A1Y2GG91_9FUNG|nr:hypothetical protein BCR41DRAFT_398558 [Lobosporangium transversale]ORZ10017.1 hypothetical protein BCR41DRAFT_398558 [Lobosporangium transversale]|eukprot:XP_021879107.1 hypothetical protein BCR41DRAFT_398558 [Lobosporangium transversale]